MFTRETVSNTAADVRSSNSNELTSQRANKPMSQRANELTSQQVNEPMSQRANEPTSRANDTDEEKMLHVPESPERSSRCMEVTVEEGRRRIREMARPATRPFHPNARDVDVSLSCQGSSSAQLSSFTGQFREVQTTTRSSKVLRKCRVTSNKER
jgi:hypothetical protein